jgi:ABC-type lipoprotein release transport system permease subunit
MLVFVVVGFIRGLERSLAISGDPDVVLVYSVSAETNIENSSIAASSPSLLAASVDATRKRFGVNHVSPELYFGTRVTTQNGRTSLGLVRGVTSTAPLVRRQVRLVAGDWPRDGEVLIGCLAAAKLGGDPEQMQVGDQIEFEGRNWKISGRFNAQGSAYESEIWCPLADFQTAAKRQDLSLVAVLLAPGGSAAELGLFCKERNDLELRAIRETEYYASLQQHYRPVRMLAWVVVGLISGAGVFAGLNMMYGAVLGRIREIAMLQTIGFRRRAILVSVVQEGVLLAAAGSLLSGAVALTLLNGMAVRFTMGAFTLRIDGVAILIGCGTGLILGALGALPPAIKALRVEVAASLKAV